MLRSRRSRSFARARENSFEQSLPREYWRLTPRFEDEAVRIAMKSSEYAVVSNRSALQLGSVRRLGVSQ